VVYKNTHASDRLLNPPRCARPTRKTNPDRWSRREGSISAIAILFGVRAVSVTASIIPRLVSARRRRRRSVHTHCRASLCVPKCPQPIGCLRRRALHIWLRPRGVGHRRRSWAVTDATRGRGRHGGGFTASAIALEFLAFIAASHRALRRTHAALRVGEKPVGELCLAPCLAEMVRLHCASKPGLATLRGDCDDVNYLDSCQTRKYPPSPSYTGAFDAQAWPTFMVRTLDTSATRAQSIAPRPVAVLDP
jgi:hypothetical protein